MKKLIGGGLTALAIGLVVTPVAHADSYNRETVAQFIATVNATAAKYGTGAIAVRVEHFDDGTTLAQTTDSGIVINSTWAAVSPAQFNAAIAEDVRRRYTPGGCAGIQATAIHEVGHILDRRSGQVARRAVGVAANKGKINNDELHTYALEGGKLSPGEAVAISFQAVECGSATSTEKNIYNLLVEELT
jgi:hypothetical protein